MLIDGFNIYKNIHGAGESILFLAFCCSNTLYKTIYLNNLSQYSFWSTLNPLVPDFCFPLIFEI